MRNKSWKRAFALLSAFAMMVTLLPAGAIAADTQDESIAITSADDLIALAYVGEQSETNAKQLLSKHYILTGDIDLKDATDPRPMKAIGTKKYSGSLPFTGTFDGQGFAISSLETTGAALFDTLAEGGEIKNLTLKKASIHFSKNDSSYYPAALVSSNYGTITHCFTVDSVVVSDYCSSAGGLVGTNYGTGVILKSGVVGGSVSLAVTQTSTSHGGFVGSQRDGGRIEQCFSTAAVDAKKWAGGFIGKVEGGTITDCYALGDVRGTEQAGGFAGALMDPAVLINCYASNDVTASDGGPFVGGKGFSFGTLGACENCFYNNEAQAPDTAVVTVENGLTGKTDSEMQSKAFAANLSDAFGCDTEINGGYPYLMEAVPPVGDSGQEKQSVSFAVAFYDGSTYSFFKNGPVLEVAMDPEDSSFTVLEAMDLLVEDNLMQYTYGTGSEAGLIRTIDGRAPARPGGWMFTINDKLSPAGAPAAILSPGDRVLWYEGTAANQYRAPLWDELTGVTQDIVYQEIASEEALLALTRDSEGWDGNYKLTADLDLTGMPFSPIGSEETPFTGIFDGNGFTISGLTLAMDADSQNVGFFGVLCGAVVKNVSLACADVTGGSRVGVLCGYAKVDAGKEKGNLIAHCHADGSLTAIGTVYIRQTDAGGLVGYNGGDSDQTTGKSAVSVIDGCTADVAVQAVSDPDPSEFGHIGGLVGYHKGVVKDSTASGTVAGGNTTGGFVGANDGGIYACNAKGQVSGSVTVGGFVGSSATGSEIEDCTASGDVKAAGQYGSYYGGFAGSASGKFQNCVSAGTLTPGWSYNGGFAGAYSGNVWSYNEDLITLNHCFGNHIAQDGSALLSLGNYIGGMHAQTDQAVESIGITKEDALGKIDQIKKASQISLVLSSEADKYLSRVAIPANVSDASDVTALIAKLQPNAAPNDSVQVEYHAQGETIRSEGNALYLAKSEPGTTDTVALSLQKDGVNVEKQISVTVFAPPVVDRCALLSDIAEQYKDHAVDYWHMLVVAAYSKQDHGGTALAAKTKKAFAKQLVEEIIAEDDVLDTTLAMGVIVLDALGYDPTQITAKDGAPIDLVSMLRDAPSSGNNGDAFRLIAATAGGDATEAEIAAVAARLVRAQTKDGGWDNNETAEADPDTTGAVLAALAGVSPKIIDTQGAVDEAVSYLSGLVAADGNIRCGYQYTNYGTNANTSAMAIVGLSAVGIDVESDERFCADENSLIDGLLGFARPEDGGFSYEYNGAVNDFATKQAALALVAADQGNVFQFAQEQSNRPLDLTEQGQGGIVVNPDPPVSGKDGQDDTETVSVTFTLIGDTVHGVDGQHAESIWIEAYKAKVKQGTSALALVETILTAQQYSYTGTQKGYIESVTTPDGMTLRAGSNGPQSGWMYLINQKAPNVGMGDYALRDGDSVVVYFADQWEDSEDSSDIDIDRKDNSFAYTDVGPDDWFSDAVAFVTQKEWFDGFEDGTFRPNQSMTRAMFATVLARKAGFESAGQPNVGVFGDVGAEEWFAPFVMFTYEKGFMNGVGQGVFAPNDSVTREQIAVILYRLAIGEGILSDNVWVAEQTLGSFTDRDKVADWASDALCFAVSAGLIDGLPDGMLAPKEPATRAQVAAILQRYDAYRSSQGKDASPILTQDSAA